jgi:hypothetical protein
MIPPMTPFLNGWTIPLSLCQDSMSSESTEAKSNVPEWGIKSTLEKGQGRLWHRVAHSKCAGIDSGVDIM